MTRAFFESLPVMITYDPKNYRKCILTPIYISGWILRLCSKLWVLISRAINSLLFLSYSRLGCVDWNCESTRAGVESWRAYQLSLAAQPIIHQDKVLLSLQHGGKASTASSELPQNPLCRPIFTLNTIFSWLNCVSKAISSYFNCPCFKFCFPVEFSYVG